jgi:hypothetical protein
MSERTSSRRRRCPRGGMDLDTFFGKIPAPDDVDLLWGAMANGKPPLVGGDSYMATSKGPGRFRRQLRTCVRVRGHRYCQVMARTSPSRARQAPFLEGLPFFRRSGSLAGRGQTGHARSAGRGGLSFGTPGSAIHEGAGMDRRGRDRLCQRGSELPGRRGRQMEPGAPRSVLPGGRRGFSCPRLVPTEMRLRRRGARDLLDVV